MPVVEELAKRFHVYALIMRFDGLNQGIEHMMGMAMRKQKIGIPKKIAEVRSIGDATNKPEFQKYAPSPELIWDSLEDCDKALKNMTVPVGYCFGTQDPVFQDYYESNIYGIMNTRGSRTVFLDGVKA